MMLPVSADLLGRGRVNVFIDCCSFVRLGELVFSILFVCKVQLWRYMKIRKNFLKNEKIKVFVKAEKIASKQFMPLKKEWAVVQEKKTPLTSLSVTLRSLIYHVTYIHSSLEHLSSWSKNKKPTKQCEVSLPSLIKERVNSSSWPLTAIWCFLSNKPLISLQLLVDRCLHLLNYHYNWHSCCSLNKETSD